MRIYWLEQSESDVPPDSAWLHPGEAARLDAMRFPKRRADFRLGRWTAKRALSAYFNINGAPPGSRQSPVTSDQLQKRPRADSRQPKTNWRLETGDWRLFEIRAADSGEPEVFIDGKPSGLTISISHRDGRAACAVTGSTTLLGCDLELIEPRSADFAVDYFTAEERARIEAAAVAQRSGLLALLWSAKESALKALHLGLRCDTRSLTVSPALDHAADGWCALHIRAEGRTLHGWYRTAGDLVRTVVASPPALPPLPLQIAHRS